VSNTPIKEVVPGISQQPTLFVYELLDAHDDTARLAPTWRPTCAGSCTWAISAISSAWDAGLWLALNWARLITTPRCLAEHAGARAEGNFAFMYEASDVRPGITIGEFRSQRSGNRRRRGLRAWLRRLLSRGQGWASARRTAPCPTRSVAGANDEGDL
jgi:hypothetical protein